MAQYLLLLVCAAFSTVYLANAITQGAGGAPRTRFTCHGRPSGYYADIDTGCQVYHMCDGLGRQFSYTCPNTTLFQQRMLICDHWYMVNCTNSEGDYDANLLIGQRDKPFVSEEDMKRRTPRPDILSVPPNNNYYDGLKEAESKYPIHPGNSIVGIPDSIYNSNNNGLDSAKQTYRPPTSWSTGTGVNKQFNQNTPTFDQDHLAGAASQEPTPTFQTTPDGTKTGFQNTRSTPLPNFNAPTTRPPFSLDLVPPFPDKTTTEEPTSDYDIDVRMKPRNNDRVFNFIKRFDPNSPDSHKTAMSRTEIINLNKHLPEGQVSSEDERTQEKSNNAANDFNKLNRGGEKGVTESTRFNTVNIKTASTEANTDEYGSVSVHSIPTPSKNLLPPKKDLSDPPSTTMGPPVYYEWKWAVPAFDLAPPKLDNATNTTEELQPKVLRGRSPFSSVTRPPTTTEDPKPQKTEYDINSYFVPDYIFPLDKPHPGYEADNAQTSFQVKVERKGRASYGENPACPQCHPAYLKPGSCEPCIVNR